MAKRLAFERYLWLHGRLKRGRNPRIAEFMEAFEISRRQAARDIEFLRDFFRAPIRYSARDRAYYYDDTSFELPGLWTTEEELVALIITKRLASVIPDEGTRSRISRFFDQVSARMGLDMAGLEGRISLKNIRFQEVKSGVFDTVVFALSGKRKLKLRYRSPYGGGESDRVVSPLHLLLYMGNWHLIGYCEWKQGLRDFLLSRMVSLELLPDSVEPERLQLPVNQQVDQHYGIFFEGEGVDVTIRFSAGTAGMAREQVWYPGQKVRDCEDGSVELTFPVADFREIAGDILRYGAEVEVISPPELRRQVSDIAKAIASRYTGG